MSTNITGRFAPSPSGRMHLGNAFSYLLAWLSARSAGGRIVLRQEDLDPARCSLTYANQLESDLLWLGLDWDEGGSRGGLTYYQSHRSELYAHYLHQLETSGLIYPCFCTRGELHAPSAPHASDGTPVYAGTCRALSSAQRAEKAKLRRPSLRIRVPEREIAFTVRPPSANLILRRYPGLNRASGGDSRTVGGRTGNVENWRGEWPEEREQGSFGSLATPTRSFPFQGIVLRIISTLLLKLLVAVDAFIKTQFVIRAGL